MTTTADDLQRVLDEIERKTSAQQHLADYAQQVVGVKPAAHHRYICDELERGVLNDEWDDCVICLPPGGAKSTYASHCFPAWYMGRFPERNAILASHTANLAEKWSRRVRDTVASPAHNNVFPHSTLSKDSTAVAKWSTSVNGEFLAAGVGMAILGNRADIVVLDDPVSGWEEAQSVTQLQKLHEWFKADLKSRLKPRAKIIIICQRTAAYDMAGYVIKEHEENPTRRLRTIILPMLAGEDDPLGRAPGDRLWPEWYTPEMVADLRKDEYIWKTMWQQEPPSDTGSWVSADDIHLVDEQFAPPPTAPTYVAADIALSVNSGDYTVHLVARTDHELNLFVVHATRERTSVDDTADRALTICEDYRPYEYLIDDDNASKVYAKLLERTSRDTNRYIPFKTMPLRGQDKETRAAAIRGWIKRGKVFFVRAPWNQWLIRQMLTFPNAVGQGVDDGIDCLSLFGRRLTAMAKPVLVASEGRQLHPLAQTATLNEMFEDRERTLPHRRRI